MSKRPSPRPTFELRSKLPPDEIARRVGLELKGSDTIAALALPTRVELTVIGEERRLWSPQLSADLIEHEGETRLRARFGPDPAVWIAYVFTYGALGTLALIALAYGVSQMMLKQTPTALIVAGATSLLGGLTYGASFVGQGLGSEQMYRLRATLVELAEADEVE
ncbi:MAG: hypothetical protein IPM79_00720 [Polyangiaceae bacterium]|jgi:hypothetical protein|nr:hypothetical protein [Polyangiaceae bacterium]MBK8936200.1 hypothetical protein [Polyangiaceae bacterium]